MRFRDLTIGQTFDFNAPADSLAGVGSFTARCTKTSPRGYSWQDASGRELSTNVGTINVPVFNVEG